MKPEQATGTMTGQAKRITVAMTVMTRQAMGNDKTNDNEKST